MAHGWKQGATHEDRMDFHRHHAGAVDTEELRMTKEEALQAIKLLSALESWAFSQSTRLPDYLVDDIQRSMEVLERIVLEKP